MIYIILSVCCSVSVAILLKLARRYQINIIQAVSVNYLSALSLCYLFFKPDLSLLKGTIPWTLYATIAILLPSVFLFLAASIRNLGIVKTDIAQRLSLFIPILAAYFIFKEEFNQLKMIGLLIGFPAIFMTFFKNEKSKSGNGNYVYPLMVFFGFGVIDTLFKQVALFKAVPYTTSLFTIFCMAFIVSLIIVSGLLLANKIKLQWINILCGLILGIFNFGNILFYLKAHQTFAGNPSTVFASMNLGVIILGSLIGIFIFKEKINKLNYIGLVLALVAVIIITLSQHVVR